MGVFQDGEVGGLVPKGTKKRKTKRKAKLGVKDVPWFTFIPFDHFTVPLLHCLIDIQDNILTKSRDMVSVRRLSTYLAWRLNKAFSWSNRGKD